MVIMFPSASRSMSVLRRISRAAAPNSKTMHIDTVFVDSLRLKAERTKTEKQITQQHKLKTSHSLDNPKRTPTHVAKPAATKGNRNITNELSGRGPAQLHARCNTHNNTTTLIQYEHHRTTNKHEDHHTRAMCKKGRETNK